jgi:hypothetical protein
MVRVRMADMMLRGGRKGSASWFGDLKPPFDELRPSFGGLQESLGEL